MHAFDALHETLVIVFACMFLRVSVCMCVCVARVHGRELMCLMLMLSAREDHVSSRHISRSARRLMESCQSLNQPVCLRACAHVMAVTTVMGASTPPQRASRLALLPPSLSGANPINRVVRLSGPKISTKIKSQRKTQFRHARLINDQEGAGTHRDLLLN